MPTSQVFSSAPLISFIVTTYNLPGEMLRECLDSILRLTLTKDEREIIVVDDGSDITPLNELNDIQDEIIYLRQRNKGQSAARNKGLQCASGKYIQFVDGDDYLLQAPYEHCLDIIRYQQADMVLFQETRKTTTKVPFLHDGPMTGTSYMHQNNLHSSVCGYIFRRGILGALRFPEGIIHEDEEFTPLLLLRAESVYSTQAKAYFYRKRDNSTMTKHNRRHTVKRLNDTLSVILRLKEMTDRVPRTERQALNRRIAQLSMDYLYNTIKLTHSNKHLNVAIKTLRQYGLYPLPNKKYTRKYTVFRNLIGHSFGRRLLLATIKPKIFP
ncbi:MAG: glycosyltransferase family 2 protein [Prevotella sp.]|jgi:glycosyltransferase involved in cell wall biosynthesis